MTQKQDFLLLFLLLLVFLTGCSRINSSQLKESEEKISQDIAEYEELEKKEELICDQEMIPAKYAKQCYFLKFKDCSGYSDKSIPKSELEKCVFFFLIEAVVPEADEINFRFLIKQEELTN